MATVLFEKHLSMDCWHSAKEWWWFDERNLVRVSGSVVQVLFSLTPWLDSEVISKCLSKGLGSSRGCDLLGKQNLWSSIYSILYLLSHFTSFSNQLLVFGEVVDWNCICEQCEVSKKEKKDEYMYFMCIYQSMHVGIRYLSSNSGSASY